MFLYHRPQELFLFLLSIMVYAFVCSRIDYCNSLLIGLPKSRLAPLQSVLNAAARLIARIPRFYHMSTFMTEKLHWLSLSARIQFKIIFLIYKAFLGLAPSYLSKLIIRPLSAISDCPLRSLDRVTRFHLCHSGTVSEHFSLDISSNTPRIPTLRSPGISQEQFIWLLAPPLISNQLQTEP